MCNVQINTGSVLEKPHCNSTSRFCLHFWQCSVTDSLRNVTSWHAKGKQFSNVWSSIHISFFCEINLELHHLPSGFFSSLITVALSLSAVAVPIRECMCISLILRHNDNPVSLVAAGCAEVSSSFSLSSAWWGFLPAWQKHQVSWSLENTLSVGRVLVNWWAVSFS